MHNPAVQRRTTVHLQTLIMDLAGDLRRLGCSDAAGLHDAVIGPTNHDKVTCYLAGELAGRAD